MDPAFTLHWSIRILIFVAFLVVVIFLALYWQVPDDTRQERRRERNRRTVEAEKRERKLIPDQFKNDPVPAWVCYDCLWRGGRWEVCHDFGDIKDLARYCPDCGAKVEDYDAETNDTPERDVGPGPT